MLCRHMGSAQRSLPRRVVVLMSHPQNIQGARSTGGDPTWMPDAIYYILYLCVVDYLPISLFGIHNTDGTRTSLVVNYAGPKIGLRNYVRITSNWTLDVMSVITTA